MWWQLARHGFIVPCVPVVEAPLVEKEGPVVCVSGVIPSRTKYPDVLTNLPVVQLDQLLGLFRLPIGLESEGLRIKLQYVLELTRCALRKESCCVFHGSHCDN